MFAFCPLYGEGSYGERITSPLHPLSAYCDGNVYSVSPCSCSRPLCLIPVKYLYCSGFIPSRMVRSPPSPFTLPPLGPTPSESLVPVTMVSPWCRAWTRCFVILSWVSKQQQVHVKTVTGVLGPAGFVVLEQHGRLPATPYHPLFYLPPPSGTIIDVSPHSSYYVYLSCFSCVMSELVVL